MKKTFLLFLTAVLLSVASAFAQGGTTGPLTWNISGNTLTISGTGAMPDYEQDGAPWYSYRSSIYTIVLQNGIETIGNNAFYHCFNLTSVTIPNSITSIGSKAFWSCYALASATIPQNVTSIGGGAFSVVIV